MAGTPSHPDLARAFEAEIARAFERVADLIAPRINEVAEELAKANAEQIPGVWLSRGTIRANVQIIELVMRSFRRGEPFAEEDAEEIAKSTRAWAQTATFEAIAESFHVGLRRLVSLVGESARELQLDAALMFALQDRAWESAMFGAKVIADVQREDAVTTARRDATRRADLIRDLAGGQMTAARLAEESAIYGLDMDQPYFAVCAPADDLSASALETSIRNSGATSTHRVLQVTSNGRLLAVTASRPRAPDGATVAVGSPMKLSSIHESFVEAEEALAAATAFGITGTVDLTTVGPLTLVTVSDRVAARLADRYLGDLGESFSEVEDTVLTLLDLDQNIEKTAARMHLHRNTVRYRVTRFRELTGLDIRETHGFVTTWWLLKWRHTRARD
jgi:hypothetical protein